MIPFNSPPLPAAPPYTTPQLRHIALLLSLQQHPLGQEPNKDTTGAGYSQRQLQQRQEGWCRRRHGGGELSPREPREGCTRLARGCHLPGDLCDTPVKRTQPSPQPGATRSPATQWRADTRGTPAALISTRPHP